MGEKSQRGGSRITVWFKPENHEWLKNNVENISKFLDEIITAYREQKKVSLTFKSKNNADPAGFEPAIYGLGGPIFEIDYDTVRVSFKKWLYKRISKDTANDYIRYLDRYMRGVVLREPVDLFEVNLLVERGWNHYAKAVRNLLNYYMERGLIPKSLVVEYKSLLKLKKTGTDTYVPPDPLVQEALEKCEIEDHLLVGKLLLYSGIRVTEALKILSEFDQRRLHFVDSVAYYDLDWERGCKKSFKAFMPVHFAEQLHRVNLKPHAVYKYFSNRGLNLKYARNWFIDKMVKARVPESIIKFMIGHSTGSVLMTNYLEKLNNSIREYSEKYHVLEEVIESVEVVGSS